MQTQVDHAFEELLARERAAKERLRCRELAAAATTALYGDEPLPEEDGRTTRRRDDEV